MLHPNVYQCIIHNFQKDADVKQGVTHDNANAKEKERLVVEDATAQIVQNTILNRHHMQQTP